MTEEHENEQYEQMQLPGMEDPEPERIDCIVTPDTIQATSEYPEPGSDVQVPEPTVARTAFMVLIDGNNGVTIEGDLTKTVITERSATVGDVLLATSAMAFDQQVAALTNNIVPNVVRNVLEGQQNAARQMMREMADQRLAEQIAQGKLHIPGK